MCIKLYIKFGKETVHVQGTTIPGEIGPPVIGILVHLMHSSYGAIESGCSGFKCFNEYKFS